VATVLVTGGAGYVGAHACKALAAAGHRPVVFDSLVRGRRHAVLWGPLVVGDITDRAALDAAFVAHTPDAVMHFAALAEVGHATRDPLACYHDNVAGTAILAECARRHGVTRLVFSSTCAVYGPPEAIPITEAAPHRPANVYGRSKAMAETVLREAAEAGGLSAVALRYFNAAGASADAEIGEDHDPETHLVPKILLAALGRTDAINIYGTDYETPDGTCVRDYVHVEDLASAHVLALDWLLGGARGFHAFNLGSGRGYSVRHIVAEAIRVTGVDIKVVEGPRRTGDVAQLVADPSAAHRVLGWRAERSDIANIVATAWAALKGVETRRASAGMPPYQAAAECGDGEVLLGGR